MCRQSMIGIYKVKHGLGKDLFSSILSNTAVIKKETQVEKNAAFGRKALRLTLRFWQNRRVFRGKM